MEIFKEAEAATSEVLFSMNACTTDTVRLGWTWRTGKAFTALLEDTFWIIWGRFWHEFFIEKAIFKDLGGSCFWLRSNRNKISKTMLLNLWVQAQKNKQETKIQNQAASKLKIHIFCPSISTRYSTVMSTNSIYKCWVHRQMTMNLQKCQKKFNMLGTATWKCGDA